jgi:hypothetical protein
MYNYCGNPKIKSEIAKRKKEGRKERKQEE